MACNWQKTGWLVQRRPRKASRIVHPILACNPSLKPCVRQEFPDLEAANMWLVERLSGRHRRRQLELLTLPRATAELLVPRSWQSLGACCCPLLSTILRVPKPSFYPTPVPRLPCTFQTILLRIAFQPANLIVDRQQTLSLTPA